MASEAEFSPNQRHRKASRRADATRAKRDFAPTSPIQKASKPKRLQPEE